MVLHVEVAPVLGDAINGGLVRVLEVGLGVFILYGGIYEYV